MERNFHSVITGPRPGHAFPHHDRRRLQPLTSMDSGITCHFSEGDMSMHGSTVEMNRIVGIVTRWKNNHFIDCTQTILLSDVPPSPR
jgi:hypothetical protein